MKIISSSLVSLGALFSCLLSPVMAKDGLRVLERVDPVFPTEVILEGISRGAVRCVVDIDENGRVEDVLITEYTHRAFARVVRDAMKLWRFEPARLEDKAVPSQTFLEFTIEGVGVVVTMDYSSFVRQRFETVWGQPYDYRTYSLQEIDRIPEPRKTTSPRFPQRLAERGFTGTVRVDFFIDEQGRIRMPIPQKGSAPELAGAAIDALRQWEFSPPTRLGRPVLVRASQEFHFKP